MKSDNEKFKKEFKARLYKWVVQLLKFVDRLPKGSVSEVLIKQLIRSATSVLANYIEASAASSKKDFTNFFYYSLKSANVSKVWLALLRDLGKGDKEELNKLLDELTQIANILATSILTLKGRN